MPKAIYFPRAVKLEFSVLAELAIPRIPVSRCRSCSICWARTTRQRGLGPAIPGAIPDPKLDAIIDKAAMTLDDGKRNALLAEAYEYAIGQQVVVIPMLFPVTTWAMRKGIAYSGFPQETTVASLVHMAK